MDRDFILYRIATLTACIMQAVKNRDMDTANEQYRCLEGLEMVLATPVPKLASFTRRTECVHSVEKIV